MQYTSMFPRRDLIYLVRFIYVCFYPTIHFVVPEWDFEGTLNIGTYLHFIAVSHANSRGCSHQSMSFRAKSLSFQPLTHKQGCTGRYEYVLAVYIGKRQGFCRGSGEKNWRKIGLETGLITAFESINNSKEICQGWLKHKNVCPPCVPFFCVRVLHSLKC